jgi:cellulose biosynthesis protein BcsQ
MKGIAIISKKGGVGKTSLCHLLALGSAWNNIPSYLFHTDDRKPMEIDGRPYAYIDGRDLNRLSTVAESLMTSDGLCIIDGGGNRPEFDKWISEFVDIVLIPVTADTESIDLGIETMESLKEEGIDHAYYLMNMTSSHQNARLFDFNNFYSKLDEKKIIGGVKRVDAVKRLRISDTEPFETPPTNVNNLSRALYNIVNDKMLDNKKAN